MVKDVVCGMDVDEKTASDFLEFPQKTFYFCSPQCKFDFLQNPGRYMPQEAERQQKK